MIAITAVLKSKSENAIQVLEMLKVLVTETRKESACKRYDLHYTENDFIIWEEWENEEGLDLHNTMPYLQHFIQESTDLLSREITIFKTVDVF